MQKFRREPLLLLHIIFQIFQIDIGSYKHYRVVEVPVEYASPVSLAHLLLYTSWR